MEPAGPRRVEKFQSTRPARGATSNMLADPDYYKVSIHAPRAGRDGGGGHAYAAARGFNPRAPRGARQKPWFPAVVLSPFQSTRPARGATPRRSFPPSCQPRFNPRAPRGARLRPRSRKRCPTCFNPRAPRGARRRRNEPPSSRGEFQSTRPARGATSDCVGVVGRSLVSIHAPRAGRDMHDQEAEYMAIVSIHAPRAGRDVRPAIGRFGWASFNPRAPRGARPSASLSGVPP